jgi:hypothetical protein
MAEKQAHGDTKGLGGDEIISFLKSILLFQVIMRMHANVLPNGFCGI